MNRMMTWHTVFSVCFLVSCSDHIMMHPMLNPHPNYFVTISGTIDRKFKKPVYFAFWAIYDGYNPTCSTSTDADDDTSEAPEQSDFYPALPNAQGHYRIVIPIDRYQGPCDWKITWIDYSISYQPLPKNEDTVHSAVGALIQFGRSPSANPAFPINHTETLYACKEDLTRCKGHTLTAGNTLFVSRKKSYAFIQNIKY